MKKRMSVFLITLLLGSIALLGTGCDMKLPPMPWDPKPAAKPGDDKAGADANAQDAEQSDAEASHGPLDERSLLPADMKALPFIEVTIPMKDGLKLYGRLYDPGLKPDDPEAGDGVASAPDAADYKGPKYPLLILLHGLNRSHLSWSDVPVAFVKSGYAVFALDLRGHGKSTSTVRGQRVTWRLFMDEHWKAMPGDVVQVIQAFQKGEDYPEIDGKNVALMGEKLGANVAAMATIGEPEAVKALVLISPGEEYKGLMPSQALMDFKNPALLLSSQDDDYSNTSTHRLYNWILGSKALLEYGRVGDGVEMLLNRPGIRDTIRAWLLKVLPTAVGSVDDKVEADKAAVGEPSDAIPGISAPEAAPTDAPSVATSSTAPTEASHATVPASGKSSTPHAASPSHGKNTAPHAAAPATSRPPVPHAAAVSASPASVPQAATHSTSTAPAPHTGTPSTANEAKTAKP
jgi:pimeloyl-ACP methyl ester carboxylesterase